jgi:hypothetical protein
MAALYEVDDHRPIEKLLSCLYFQALGLNKHIPRTVLSGPTHLGGMNIMSLQSMLTVI